MDKSKIWSQRQARWAKFFTKFDFVLTYRPGSKGGKPDALSRRSEYRQVGDGTSKEPGSILQPNHFRIMALRSYAWSSDFFEDLKKALETDSFAMSVRSAFHDPAFRKQVKANMNLFSEENGILLYNNLI